MFFWNNYVNLWSNLSHDARDADTITLRSATAKVGQEDAVAPSRGIPRVHGIALLRRNDFYPLSLSRTPS